jgi:hypothetical protein
MSSMVQAEPVWHCSKSPTSVSSSDYLDKPSQIGKAAIIRLEIRDLYEVYQNIPVYLGNKELTACFMSSADIDSQAAFTAIGTSPEEVAMLSQENKHLVKVKDESEMIQCISQHHPAVGYLSGLAETKSVGACF